MSREDFIEAIGNLLEFITKHRMSRSARELIIHYFNNSREAGAFERALDAIGNYLQDDDFMKEHLDSPKLQKHLDELEEKAALWEHE